jgi:hypothetical protein
VYTILLNIFGKLITIMRVVRWLSLLSVDKVGEEKNRLRDSNSQPHKQGNFLCVTSEKPLSPIVPGLRLLKIK